MQACARTTSNITSTDWQGGNDRNQTQAQTTRNAAAHYFEEQRGSMRDRIRRNQRNTTRQLWKSAAAGAVELGPMETTKAPGKCNVTAAHHFEKQRGGSSSSGSRAHETTTHEWEREQQHTNIQKGTGNKRLSELEYKKKEAHDGGKDATLCSGWWEDSDVIIEDSAKGSTDKGAADGYDSYEEKASYDTQQYAGNEQSPVSDHCWEPNTLFPAETACMEAVLEPMNARGWWCVTKEEDEYWWESAKGTLYPQLREPLAWRWTTSRSSRKTPRGIEVYGRPKVHGVNRPMVCIADVFGLLDRNEDTKILAIVVIHKLIKSGISLCSLACGMDMLRAKGSVNISQVNGIEDFCDESGQAAVNGCRSCFGTMPGASAGLGGIGQSDLSFWPTFLLANTARALVVGDEEGGKTLGSTSEFGESNPITLGQLTGNCLSRASPTGGNDRQKPKAQLRSAGNSARNDISIPATGRSELDGRTVYYDDLNVSGN
ncbi:hypothetical protein ARMSODRAFT_1006631, partial [Armillaria solidipes]